MAELVACGVVERSKDVTCTGGAILVEGKKGKIRVQILYQLLSFKCCIYTACIYPLPTIPKIVDKQGG